MNCACGAMRAMRPRLMSTLPVVPSGVTQARKMSIHMSCYAAYMTLTESAIISSNKTSGSRARETNE